MKRETGHGNLGKLIGALVLGSVIVGVGTYLGPWTQEYEVRTAISFTCSEMMRVRMQGEMSDAIKEQFLSRLRRTEVRVKEGDYAVTTKHVPPNYVCEGKVVYKTATPWIGVTSLKPDLPPLKLHHVVKVKKEIADRW